MIQISLKGFAKFMTATSFNQRKILQDYKFPDPEGEAQARYYRELRQHVPTFHQMCNPEGWLSQKALEARTLSQIRGGVAGIRLRNISRAFIEYERAWGAKHFEILKRISLPLIFHDVKISTYPDLHLIENHSEKIVRLEFSSERPNDKLFRIMSQTMFEAASQAGLGLSASGVLIFDVPRGKAYPATKAGVRMRREIEAACQNIANIWPALEPAVSSRRHAS